jgi:hypothetical protein
MIKEKEGMIRYPSKDEDKDHNWVSIRCATDDDFENKYIASEETFINGKWILSAWRKEKDWPEEKLFNLIDGKWIETEIKKISDNDIKKILKNRSSIGLVKMCECPTLPGVKYIKKGFIPPICDDCGKFNIYIFGMEKKESILNQKRIRKENE